MLFLYTFQVINKKNVIKITLTWKLLYYISFDLHKNGILKIICFTVCFNKHFSFLPLLCDVIIINMKKVINIIFFRRKMKNISNPFCWNFVGIFKNETLWNLYSYHNWIFRIRIIKFCFCIEGQMLFERYLSITV